MRRCLVVANRTLAGDQLMERIRARLESGEVRVHVLVPATPDPSGWTHDESSAHARARERLDAALAKFAALGIDVTGEVGNHLPFEAVTDVIRREAFDEIIVSTLPPGVSKWLGMDLLSRLGRATDIPIEHVVAEEDIAQNPR